MTVFTSEYVSNNTKLDETPDIVEYVEEDCRQKYNANCWAKEIVCVVQFLDKIKNETKTITINCELNFKKISRIMQSSKGVLMFVRNIELKKK